MIVNMMMMKEKQESGAAALSLQNVGGIFVVRAIFPIKLQLSSDLDDQLALMKFGNQVLLAGLGIACVTAVIEYVWTKKAQHREHRVSLRIIMMEKIKATGQHKTQ